MSLSNLTSSQLRQAATLKDKIQSLQKELAKLVGTTEVKAPAARPAKRKMSAAGRAKIRAAQKARWAKIKAATAK